MSILQVRLRPIVPDERYKGVENEALNFKCDHFLKRPDIKGYFAGSERVEEIIFDIANLLISISCLFCQGNILLQIAPGKVETSGEMNLHSDLTLRHFRRIWAEILEMSRELAAMPELRNIPSKSMPLRFELAQTILAKDDDGSQLF